MEPGTTLGGLPTQCVPDRFEAFPVLLRRTRSSTGHLSEADFEAASNARRKIHAAIATDDTKLTPRKAPAR